MAERKLLLVKVTESDGVTPKVAKPEQNFSYDEIINQTFVECYEPELGYSAAFAPTSPNVLNGRILSTSIVHGIECDEDVWIDTLVITTMNTIYFFEVIE
ncbi:hypothetical protein M5X00_26060 [Paenibacillus alvei]|uniref:hypothetical protein n=1 Tax=Paenibacillus alvei TaxID=44250 RepID=UPI002282D668|nr:hypothetical protein [Paenibacillus alvei]MCY9757696.1 hypothetical protein [Paenibacillus alvei]